MFTRAQIGLRGSGDRLWLTYPRRAIAVGNPGTYVQD